MRHRILITRLMVLLKGVLIRFRAPVRNVDGIRVTGNIEDMDLLDLKDFIPIDIRYVASQRAKYLNVPNSDWDNIQRDIEVINNTNLPTTLRVYKLNCLPWIIIEIISYGN